MEKATNDKGHTKKADKEQSSDEGSQYYRNKEEEISAGGQPSSSRRAKKKIRIAQNTSRTLVSSTRNSDGSLLFSLQPTTSRQFIAFASFSPAPANRPMSSSGTPRKMRKRRVNTQLSAVTEMSIAAAMRRGERKR